MEERPIWEDYMIYDDDGDAIGLRDDTPPEIRNAYEAYQSAMQDYINRGEPIPR